jgi:hypothetical protein
MNRLEVGCELAVNARFRSKALRRCGYSQLVSAALVTDKSSGSLVG